MSEFENKFDLLPERLHAIVNEYIEDTKLTPLSLNEKALASPGLKSKWVLMFLSEREYLKQLKNVKEMLLEQYVSRHGKPGIPKKVVEKELLKQLNRKSDEHDDTTKIRKVDVKINEQELVVEYLKHIVEIMKGFNFEVKSCIDILKLENQ